jgi:hypothetical protein
MNLGSFGLNRTGHDGGAGRENNYNSAKNYFCQFLQSEYVKLMAEDDESDFDTWVRNNEGAQSALCDVEVIQQFASWLCHHAKKSEKYYRSEPLALRSILDMLSSTKSIFNKIFPNNTIFTGNAEQPWYTKLRSKSSQEVTRRDMKRGVISSNKAKPLGREQIRNVLQTLFSVNTFTSIRKAVYVGTTFNSAGRSGECAYTCIDNGTYWDYDEEKLYMAQKEIKVAEEKNNNYVSDYKYYLLDQYWLFFVYYICGGGSQFIGPNNRHGNFVFPELYDKESRTKGSTSSYISTILKDLMPTKSNEGKITASLLWDNEVTGTSLRRGAARTMVRKVDLQSVVAKTGHDMRGSRDSTVWEYLDGDDVLLGQGSAALAGWPNPCRPVYPPTLRNLINEENDSKFDKLNTLLFDHGFPITKVQNIKGLITTMLATFLMYLSEFKEDCQETYNKISGKDNRILSLFEEKISGIFTFDELIFFGAKIRDEWEQRNSSATTAEDDGLQLSVERLQTECFKIRAENRDLRVQVSSLKEEVKRSSSVINSIDGKLNTLMDIIMKRGDSPLSASPNLTRKRPFFEEPSPVPIHVEKMSKNNDANTVISMEVPVTTDGFVHQFGIENSKVVAQVTLSELLLLSFSKGFVFNTAEKGRNTFQNFQCFTGNPPTILRADEGRVRHALTLLYKNMNDSDRKILNVKMPNERVPEWNQERNMTALAVQDRVIDELSREELVISTKLHVKVPKRCASTVSTVIGRYDKVALDKKSLSTGQLKHSMSGFLTGTIPSPSSSLLSLSSSSSSSSSSPSSSKVHLKNKHKE